MPHVVLCDFGLCRLFGDEALAGDICEPGGGMMGTASYMSPNVMECDGPYTEVDDVYSFGICLWEIVTGRIPFAGMGPIQVLVQVSLDNRRPELKQTDRVPPQIEKLITACWHQDPFQRPSFFHIITAFDSLTA
jgi:serine/threonine protein kinase